MLTFCLTLKNKSRKIYIESWSSFYRYRTHRGNKTKNPVIGLLTPFWGGVGGGLMGILKYESSLYDIN